MLNRVVLMGRITHDLEVKHTQSGIAVLTFTVAVDRGYKKEGEEQPQTDFIRCVAYRQRGIFISEYFAKGRMIALEGHLQTRTYDDKNEVKHYVAEVIVDKVSFTGEPKKEVEATNTYEPANQSVSENNSSKGYTDDIGDINDFEVVISDDGTPF
mgnify:CR=1 FL=1